MPLLRACLAVIFFGGAKAGVAKKRRCCMDMLGRMACDGGGGHIAEPVRADGFAKGSFGLLGDAVVKRDLGQRRAML